MADVLKDAAAWLSGVLQTEASQIVIYRRGNQNREFQATFGSSLLKTSDVSGRVKMQRTDRDIIFPAVLLDFGAGPTEPVRGDVVDVVVDCVVQERFEVQSPAQGEPCFRYTDPYKTMIRIHTKRVKDF